MLKKLDKFLVALTYSYLVLPVALFALGWLKLPFAIILTILLIYAVVKATKDLTPPSIEISNPVKFLSLKIILALAITLAIIFWVYLSGIGGFTFQNEDHELRNAMLRDLTDFSWPVEYDYSAQPDTFEMAGHKGALVYYFIYWLPAALFGKVLGGWAGANLFLFIWTVLGVLLCFYWFSRNFKRISALLLLLFIFWSGLDAAGWVERGRPLTLGTHLEWWADIFQYSSNTTCLFWVFNQTVVPWLIVMLLVNRLPKKQVLFTYALCLPYGPFSFIGLAPFVAYYILSGPDARKIFSRKPIVDLKALWYNIKLAFSVSNLLIAPVIVGIFLLFFRNPGSLFGVNFLWAPLFNYKETFKHMDFVFTYFLFCLLEFGIYAFLIRGKFKKDPVFWIIVFSLLVIPSFYMGINNDFAMRVSIPGLTFLMIYVAKFLAEPSQRGLKYQILKFTLIGFLLIGAITPFNEIYRSMSETGSNPGGIIRDRWHTLSTLADFKAELGVFVVKDPQDTPFFKYLGSDHDFTKTALSQWHVLNKRINR
ncbi:MAG TPA: hypothetical protein VHY08_23430 [Bacillota bacterium]|nr:hypothetical protein [Bacillota bacterium]